MSAFIYTKTVSAFMAVMMFFTSLFLGGADVKPNAVPELSDGASVRVATFNLRYGGTGRTSVAYRAPLLTAQLNEVRPDSFGVQEANYKWISCLQKFMPEYAYVGVGRTNGKNLGEFSAVFYLKDKYTAVDSGTFWLSKTPEKAGSKDWGSQNIRICSWALLKNIKTGERYVHLNTHLDHISVEARENQMNVLLTKLNEFIDKYPIVLTGDFNDASDSVMYSIVSDVLKDSRLCAPITDSKGTFHSYGEKDELIDYVFISEDVTAQKYQVIDDKLNGDYLSDHYGIYVDIAF